MTAPGSTTGRPTTRRRVAALTCVALTLSVVGFFGGGAASAATNRIDLRALVVDDGTPWVAAIQQELTTEGVPFTAVPLASSATITPAYLATGAEARFDAVILPSDSPLGMDPTALTSIRAFEAQFGVREADMYVYPGAQLGLAGATWAGDPVGIAASVSTQGTAAGFGYMKGFTFGAGSYAALAAVPATQPTGAVVTPLVTATDPNTRAQDIVMGSYASGGVEQLFIDAALNFYLTPFRVMAHGIITWVTRGVHLGYDRNYYTMQFDDAFSSDSQWNAANHCTPGEDCAAALNLPQVDIRMTPADVAQVVSWESANGYQITLPFNGYYATHSADGTVNPVPTSDPLVRALVNNKGSFTWLNHGYEHVFQGCVQNFATIPWVCETTDGQPVTANGSNIVWTPQATIASEISTNISTGQSLGLTFDPTEYLSGEHSGMYLLPQQPVDNPNFGTALTQLGVKYIGADASREPTARAVGSALTVPRHPVAVYYNVGTTADEVSEYNWFYTAAPTGSGYCTANPTTATCLSAPLGADGFTSYIVPTDAANDLSFITANDPRPFYAHVSNLTGPDYLGLTLMSSILGTYRSEFASNTPVVNQSLTQAGQTLAEQAAWKTAAPQVTAYVQDGAVTITNPTTAATPVTVPNGTTVNGAAFGETYAGELSGWVPGNTTLQLAVPVFTSAATATVTVGTAASVSFTTTGGATTLTETGALPAGMTYTDNLNGTATLSGVPSAGAGGSYALTLTATNALGNTTQSFTLTVNETPTFTSAPATTFTVGTPGTFTVVTPSGGHPALSVSGTLPAGVTFIDNGNGTATLAGTPAVGSGAVYPLTITASDPFGTATQAFVLSVNESPAITSAASAVFVDGSAGSFTVTTIGFGGTMAITETGALPPGVTLVDNGNGTATLAGTPSGAGGTFPITLQASNVVGTGTQSFTLSVTSAAPVFTSAPSAVARRGQVFSFTVSASGVPLPAITESGPLPAGLTFTAGTGTALVRGTPTRTGTYPLTFTATNGVGSVPQTFVLTVGTPPAITSSSTGTGPVGAFFSKTVTANGYPAATLTATGLPAGLAMVSTGAGTAEISGTPTTAGAFTVTVQATNVFGTATQSLLLRLTQPPSFTSAASVSLSFGTRATFYVTTSGYPTPNLGWSGPVPPGMTLSRVTGGGARLTGVPFFRGTYTVTFRATSSAGSAVQTLQIIVG